MKKSPPAIDSSLPIWEENPALHWLTQNGKILLYALLALAIAGVIAYRLFSSHQAQQEADYWSAEKDLRQLTAPITADSDKGEDQAALARLNAAVNSHPQLQTKYDAPIAQALLNQGDLDQALPYAKRALARTEAENQPFYSDYAQTTLLIAQNQHQEALEHATALQAKMREQQAQESDKRQFGDTLFALNLLRIGMLQQKLGLAKEELNTWQEWKKLAQTATFELPNTLFKEGNVSLVDYINAREIQLTAKQ